jgi:hypothetical protein
MTGKELETLPNFGALLQYLRPLAPRGPGEFDQPAR